MRRPETGLVLRARENAADRQRALDEVCRIALKDFVGRKLTPDLMAEAEYALRHTLGEAVRAGKYVLPDGLELDRVVLGADMRIKVLFKKADAPPPAGPRGLTVDAILADVDTDRRSPFSWVPESAPAAEKNLRNRYEAVAAEINDMDEEEP